MKSLEDEILAMMAAGHSAPTAKQIAAQLAITILDARDAMHRLNEQGRAELVQLVGSRRLYLVWRGCGPAGSRNICVVCHKAFERPVNSTRKCCGRSCAVSLSWKKPGVREARCEGNTAEKLSPIGQARIAVHNKRRWAKPEEHARASAHNKKRWKDPEQRAKMSRGIRQAHGRAESRKFYSDLRKQQWQMPEFREKTLAGIRKSKGSPEARAKFSKLLRERWKDPVMREKYTRANAVRNNERLKAKNSARLSDYWNNPENAERALGTRAKGLRTRSDKLAARRTPERLAIIKALLAQRQTVAACGDAIGEDYGFVKRWLQDEGIPAGRPLHSEETKAKISASNRRTKRARHKQRSRTVMQQAPP